MGKEEFKNPHPELPVREPILKLGKMITDRVPIKLGFEKLTADSPEYWGTSNGYINACKFTLQHCRQLLRSTDKRRRDDCYIACVSNAELY